MPGAGNLAGLLRVEVEANQAQAVNVFNNTQMAVQQTTKVIESAKQCQSCRTVTTAVLGRSLLGILGSTVSGYRRTSFKPGTSAFTHLLTTGKHS